MKNTMPSLITNNQMRLMIFIIIVFLLSGGCTSLKKKSVDKNKKNEWQIKAEQSEGFSPAPINKVLEFKKSPKIVNLKKTRKLPNKKVTIKMSNAEISSVLRTLARSVNISILISDKIVGKLSVNVQETPWNQVFSNILKMHGLSYVQEDNLIRIMTDEDLANELNRERLKQSLEKLEPLVTKVIKIDYADPIMLRKSLENFMGKDGDVGGEANDAESSISVDIHTNSLIIRVVKSEMERIVGIIEELDRPTRQILIKANIVEANKSTAMELGAQWSSVGGKMTGSMEFPVLDGGILGYVTTSGKNTLSLQLSALQEDGKLNILSSPSITTVDNKKAMIESGKEIPYQTIEDEEVKIEYKKAVIRLEVTPHVINDEVLKLVILINKDEIDNSVEVLGNPGIITKKAQTEVVLFDGDTTVIAGLNKDKDEKSDRGIPWLKNIPLLGHLFKWESKSNEMEELLIFITPEILKIRELDGNIATGERQ